MVYNAGRQASSPTATHLARREAFWAWPRLVYFFTAYVACLLLILSIQYGNGYYNFFSLRLLLISVGLWFLLIPVLFWARRSALLSPAWPGLLTRFLLLPAALLLILALVLGLQDMYIYYNQIPFYPLFVRGMVWIVIVLVASYVPDALNLINWKYFRYRFALLVGLSLLLKFVTVFASYINLIDVGIMMQEASAHLLAGRNPYITPTAGYGGFNYPPMHLLLPLPFYVLFGDSRFGTVVWELIGIAFLYRLVTAELVSAQLIRLSELVMLLFVWQPRSLFVIEQAWGEPLAVGVAGAAFYFFYRRPAGRVGDVLFGVLFTVKQYLIYMALPVLILYGFNWKRYLTVALTCLLVTLPFFLWDPLAFYNRNVLHFFQLPIQTNSLGLTGYVWEQQGVLIPRWISPLAAGVLSLGLSFLLRRFVLLGYLHTVILALLCLFIFGQQAFANYYYLLSFFEVASIIVFFLYCFGRSDPHNVGLSVGGQGETR